MKLEMVKRLKTLVENHSPISVVKVLTLLIQDLIMALDQTKIIIKMLLANQVWLLNKSMDERIMTFTI